MLRPLSRTSSLPNGSVSLLSLVVATVAFASPVAAPSSGAEAPPFSATRMEGGTISLESLRGQVVLLDFWAVGCPPCRIEMPELEKIHRRYSAKGLRVLGITEMDPEHDDLVRAVAELGVTYPILLDPGARIANLYGVEAHPTSVVIDAQGITRFVNAGYLKGEEKDIERAIRKALDKAKSSPTPDAKP